MQGGHTLLPDFDRSVNTIATRGPIMLTTFLLPSAPPPPPIFRPSYCPVLYIPQVVICLWITSGQSSKRSIYFISAIGRSHNNVSGAIDEKYHQMALSRFWYINLRSSPGLSSHHPSSFVESRRCCHCQELQDC